MSIRWTDAEYAAWKAKSEDRSAVPAADAQPDPVHVVSGAAKGKEVHPRYRIRVLQRRRRLIDPDGAYIKSALDGLVRGGLLADDSAEWIESIEVTQSQSKNETTEIEVWEIE